MECDWDYHHSNYSQPSCPYINNYYDFQVLLSLSSWASSTCPRIQVAATPARISPPATRPPHWACYMISPAKATGLLVKEVHRRRPLRYRRHPYDPPAPSSTGSMASPITANADYAALLNHKAGQLTLISFHDPQSQYDLRRKASKPIKPQVRRDQHPAGYNPLDPDDGTNTS